MVRFNIYGGSDRGLVRKNNEDSIACVQFEHAPVVLALVADGVGGYEGGEVASKLAVDSIHDHVRKSVLQAKSGGGFTEQWMEQVLDLAIREANEQILDQREQDPQLGSMATTIVAAVAKDHRLSLAYMGDSRCYLWRDQRLQQLSHDHTVAQQMVDEGGFDQQQLQFLPYHHVLSRALGLEDEARPDCQILEIRDADIFLLCSDGLTNCLSDEEITDILARTSDIHACGEELIASANDAGGTDNISVVLLQVLEQQE